MPRAALIVEADAEVGGRLSANLRESGFEPVRFPEGGPVLDWARSHHPDLVFLDSDLPDVPGCSLCESLKLDLRTNPIALVLLTGPDGLEEVKGLQVAADACLPRSFTPDLLQQVLAQITAWRDALRHDGTAAEIQFRLQSDILHLDKLCHCLRRQLLECGYSEVQVKQLGIAVRELATNAIEWGHRKQVDRLVTVVYRLDREKITITIRDTGPGFNPQQIPHAARAGDPVGHLAFRDRLGLREGGFGIVMARGLVDDLKYNASGNEVRLVKFLPLQDEVLDPVFPEISP